MLAHLRAVVRKHPSIRSLRRVRLPLDEIVISRLSIGSGPSCVHGRFNNVSDVHHAVPSVRAKLVSNQSEWSGRRSWVDVETAPLSSRRLFTRRLFTRRCRQMSWRRCSRWMSWGLSTEAAPETGGCLWLWTGTSTTSRVAGPSTDQVGHRRRTAIGDGRVAYAEPSACHTRNATDVFFYHHRHHHHHHRHHNYLFWNRLNVLFIGRILHWKYIRIYFKHHSSPLHNSNFMLMLSAGNWTEQNWRRKRRTASSYSYKQHSSSIFMVTFSAAVSATH